MDLVLLQDVFFVVFHFYSFFILFFFNVIFLSNTSVESCYSMCAQFKTDAIAGRIPYRPKTVTPTIVLHLDFFFVFLQLYFSFQYWC